jgi:AcrR family transcriptional regulator
VGKPSKPGTRKRAEQRSPSRGDRDAKRQALIEASKLLFSARGYHATTVDDITRAAGTAKGTFYLYFAEKREIYYEVIRSFMQLIKDIGSSIGEPTSDPADFFTRAEQAAQELMAIFMENRELARLAYRESMGLDKRLEEMLSSFYREMAELEARNIQLAIDLGIIRKVTPLLVAYAHIGIVERVLLALIDQPEDFPGPDQVVKEILQLSFEGLRLPASAG